MKYPLNEFHDHHLHICVDLSEAVFCWFDELFNQWRSKKHEGVD